MCRSGLAIIVTCAGLATFSSGCSLFGNSGADGGTSGGSSAFTVPTFELTVSGVHFGPAAPDPGSSASLVTSYDATGAVVDSTFKVNGSLASAGAGCTYTFDVFGGGAIGAGQYTVSADSTGSTTGGTVYPTSGERVLTPEGGASCAGTDCNGGALVINAIDAAHVYGYVEETMSADSGAGVADVVCTFYLPMAQYSP